MKRLRRWVQYSCCAVPLALLSLGLGYHYSGAELPLLPTSERQAWTLSNDLLSTRVSLLASGEAAITSLRERGSAREWAVPPSESPESLFRIEGTAEGHPFRLTGRGPWRLLDARRVVQPRGAMDLRLRLESVALPVTVEPHWHVGRRRAPLIFDYTVEAAPGHAVTITRADSVAVTLAAGDGRARLHWVQKGRSDDEALTKEQRDLAPGDRHLMLCSSGSGREVMESVPWLAIQRGGGGFMFGWAFSGSGRFVVERSRDTAMLRGGLDPQYFRHDLLPGEALSIPASLLSVYSGALDDGLSDFHGYLRREWLPPSPDPRVPLVQYDTWAALFERVDEANVLAEMRAARDLGVELFHLDAGWYPVIGEWQPDARRFPHGMRYLSDQAHAMGMKFGLWVAWTQVGPTLLREHPEWLVRRDVDPAAYRFDGYTSLTLCLGNRPYREWVKRQLEGIVNEYGLDYLEFDGSMIEACQRADHTHQVGDGEYSSTLGLYEVLDWLRDRHTELIIEDCSNGGHMLDYGIARRTHLASLSDLNQPVDNRRSLYGATYPFPAQMCESYMSAAPGDPETSDRSSMMGAWSISDDVAHWSRERAESCRRDVAYYKDWVRPLLRKGRIEHLLNQAVAGATLEAVAYRDPRADSGLLFAFRHPKTPNPPQAPVRVPAAWRPPCLYALLRTDGGAQEDRTGAQLAASGLPVTFTDRLRSSITAWVPETSTPAPGPPAVSPRRP